LHLVVSWNHGICGVAYLNMFVRHSELSTFVKFCHTKVEVVLTAVFVSQAFNTTN